MPWQQVGDGRARIVGDAGEDVGEVELGCGSRPFSLALSTSEYVAVAKWPPASEPAKR
jgi:hypothetical protein